MWNACSQKEACISLVSDKREDEEDNISNAYNFQHKNKGVFKKFKGPRKKVDLSRIQHYNCHKMGHYKSQCPEKPRNGKRKRDQANIVDEAPSKKNKTKESKVEDL